MYISNTNLKCSLDFILRKKANSRFRQARESFYFLFKEEAMMKKLNKTTLALILSATLVSATVSTAVQAEGYRHNDRQSQNWNSDNRNQYDGQRWNNEGRREHGEYQQQWRHAERQGHWEHVQKWNNSDRRKHHYHRQQWHHGNRPELVVYVEKVNMSDRREYDDHQQHWQHDRR